ncbi:probable F-box protein At4g22060 [Zingiber officinale]|uniref:probable F-box protein At4g22060 n=1 Tax=Zingiber officinale TaxID=94328 RepID=UPI001C4BAB3C|nr:probable F-box protein At4g22060 [Zingiber officinale]XP_042420748.1 probable F-box protein At4g22060 [Zingiber officinale]
MADSSGWAGLPLDVFSLIFSKLSLPQFLRSAAVCASWSAAVRDLSTRGSYFKFRGQSPWLVLNDNPRGDPSAITFYALDERREYTIPVPEPPISDRLFIGSAHGWIITIDARLRVLLLNPITGAQIDLPRLLPSEDTHPIRDTAGRLIGFRMSKTVSEEHHLKAILSADPSLGDGYTVALIQYFYRRIFFTRSGDEKWFQLRKSIVVENMVFHKGKLYMSTLSEVYVCDLDEEAQIEHGEMPRFRVVDRALHRDDLHYLLETPRGDLLSIWRERNQNFSKTMSVKVHRVIDDEERPSKRLEKTMDLGEEFIISLGDSRVVVDNESLSIRLEAKDLGDLIIFIFLGGGDALCLSACDFPHLAPNSIYFTDDFTGDDIIPYRFLYYLKQLHESNSQIFSASPLPMYLPQMFSERNWFRKILNCAISFSIDKTSVRLYWQPPSSSIN